MRLRIAWLALIAVAGACAPNAPDEARERRVEVRVVVADGRNPEGLRVNARREEPGEPYRVFSVDILETPVGVSAPTCAEALRRARDQAEAMGERPGTKCREDIRQDTRVTDEWWALVDDDGVARLDLLDGPYEVYGLAPLSGGCDLAGTLVLEAGESDGVLRLDSDTCAGG